MSDLIVTHNREDCNSEQPPQSRVPVPISCDTQVAVEVVGRRELGWTPREIAHSLHLPETTVLHIIDEHLPKTTPTWPAKLPTRPYSPVLTPEVVDELRHVLGGLEAQP